MWLLAAIFLTLLVVIWTVLFFLFDQHILGGVFSRKIKRWAERKFGD